MSVISNWPAVPNRVVILFRFLKEYPEGLTKDELVGLLSPRTLRAKDGEDKKGGSIADDVLAEAKALKLVENAAEGRVRVPQALQHLDEVGLLGHLEGCLLDPARAAELGQGQFPLALAWLLTVDPAEGLDWSGNHSTQVGSECGAEFELSNNRNSQNMFYWARYLGYITRLATDKANLVIPDPAAALKRHLPAILEPAEETPVSDMLKRLAKRSPVFEMGTARQAVEDLMEEKMQRRRPADLLSRSTSLALLRLERRGLIRLTMLSDATAMRLGSWPDERPVSHVIFHG